MLEQIGDITIDRIVESICPDFEPMSFFPETTPDDWARHRDWMQPRALHPDSGNIILTIQAFLVRTPYHTIVIDTCVGDHKPRPHRPNWHMTKLNTFLPRLAAAGVSPADVDYVMCTHLHWDHVGWNTRLQDGRWVPTFPNATYIFAQREVEAWQNMSGDVPQDHMQDSVLPVMEAGQAQLVANDFALNDEVWLVSTPGHTPDHVSVHLASQGARAVITGDLIHSPVQCMEPQWIMRADIDPQQAKTTRQTFLEQHCEADILVCATHFPAPSFGHIVPRDGAFWFQYKE
jgi:glyoxylase-like metal-dependent hydrolase (beta-lactamase superfamily II)